MKIRLLRTLGPGWPESYREGETVEVEKERAEQLLAAGLAEAAEGPGPKPGPPPPVPRPEPQPHPPPGPEPESEPESDPGGRSHPRKRGG
jgi:hypothetical protein